ncbi:MAG: GTP 3',8-cyclase MoaA [Aquabacterium sp.]|nr:GTP 3',8-cyclase MoaA [Aquabacterium sp.]
MTQSNAQQSGRVIPIRTSSPDVLPLPAGLASGAAVTPTDQLARPLRDLRISVTDRCNFRCGYCMPRDAFGTDHPFLPHAALLSFEEITRVARIALSLGVTKLRLTGGEPLLRKDIDKLVGQLASLRTLDGEPPELTLTTNGSLLKRKAQSLKDAGLHRVTVSLDALDQATFERMSDTRLAVSDVLAGIEAAQAVGLQPVKVNMVVQRGVNDQEILPLVSHFRHTGVELRFIEFMDVGQTNHWQMAHVLPSDEVRARINQVFALAPAETARHGATAQRWTYTDGGGHVGFISSVTQAFCGDCTRLRLSTEGRLYTCLFASQGYDLRSLLRSDTALPDEQIAARLAALWSQRADRYSQLRGLPDHPHTAGTPQAPRIEMSYIGG